VKIMFSDLPPELVSELLVKVGWVATGMCASVCRSWRDAEANGCVWHDLAHLRWQCWPQGAVGDAKLVPAPPCLTSSWKAAFRFRHLGDSSDVSMLQPVKKNRSNPDNRTYRPKKTEKIPGAPTLPRSSYMLFCSDMRCRQQCEGPPAETQPTDRPSDWTAKTLGAFWQGMQPEEKLMYGMRARQDQARFVVEKGMWLDKLSKPKH
jgi:hypothetical protein